MKEEPVLNKWTARITREERHYGLFWLFIAILFGMIAGLALCWKAGWMP